MKFDIVRAWKDENYRQSLSVKQREMLPANPVGELTDAEMEMVYGGGGGGGGGGGPMPATSAAPVAPAVHHNYYVSHHATGVVSTSASAATSSVTRFHSYSVLCDINVFSADVHVLGLDRLLNIGNCETRPCFNND